jgi:hypothetical protein
MGTILEPTSTESHGTFDSPAFDGEAFGESDRKSHPDRRELGRFFSKVRVMPSGCWVWFAGLNSSGYGVFNWRGKSTNAHRHAYEWFVRAVSDSAVIDHLCRNRHCVNPAHLEAVTLQENVRRGAWSSGLCRRGHEMTPDNIGRMKQGDGFARLCLKCRNLNRDRDRVLASERRAAAKAIRDAARNTSRELRMSVAAAAEDLFLAARSVMALHDAEAKRCNFNTCGCATCLLLKPAIAIAEGVSGDASSIRPK